MRSMKSSQNSSNISFNNYGGEHRHQGAGGAGGESGTTDPAHFHSRKSTYDNNKSYIGTSYDGANVFKNERMSVTRFLNNTNY